MFYISPPPWPVVAKYIQDDLTCNSLYSEANSLCFEVNSGDKPLFFWNGVHVFLCGPFHVALRVNWFLFLGQIYFKINLTIWILALTVFILALMGFMLGFTIFLYEKIYNMKIVSSTGRNPTKSQRLIWRHVAWIFYETIAYLFYRATVKMWIRCALRSCWARDEPKPKSKVLLVFA